VQSLHEVSAGGGVCVRLLLRGTDVLGVRRQHVRVRHHEQAARDAGHHGAARQELPLVRHLRRAAALSPRSCAMQAQQRLHTYWQNAPPQVIRSPAI